MIETQFFHEAAMWRDRARKLELAIRRALQERTTMQPEQYASRVHSTLQQALYAKVDAPVIVSTADDEREAFSRD